MPKMKTKRAAAKRFSQTGTGKLKHNKKGRRHLAVGKSRKRKRNLMGNFVTHTANHKQLKRMLGVSVTVAAD